MLNYLPLKKNSDVILVYLHTSPQHCTFISIQIQPQFVCHNCFYIEPNLICYQCILFSSCSMKRILLSALLVKIVVFPLEKTRKKHKRWFERWLEDRAQIQYFSWKCAGTKAVDSWHTLNWHVLESFSFKKKKILLHQPNITFTVSHSTTKNSQFIFIYFKSTNSAMVKYS